MREISVIVPIYNTEPYLRRCVDSILAQDFTDFELILVDDGSTDGCGAICDAYAAQDERVRVIHKENENCGPNSAIKAGVATACSKYTVFCDSDDKLEQHHLSFLFREITTSDVDVVKTGYTVISKDSTVQKTPSSVLHTYTFKAIKKSFCRYFSKIAVSSALIGTLAVGERYTNLQLQKMRRCH